VNSAVKNIVFWVVMAVTALLIYMVVKSSTAGGITDLSFTAFVDDINKDNVQDVQVAGTDVTGTRPKWRLSVLWPGLSPNSSTPSRPTAAARLRTVRSGCRGSAAATMSPVRTALVFQMTGLQMTSRSPGCSSGAMLSPETSTRSECRHAHQATPASTVAAHSASAAGRLSLPAL